jgi:hypothetical protein
MAVSKSQREAINQLISEGKIAEAQALIASLPGAVTAEGGAAAPPAAPPPPRKLEEILLDLFKATHSLLGNSPAMVAPMNELEQHVKGLPTE